MPETGRSGESFEVPGEVVEAAERAWESENLSETQAMPAAILAALDAMEIKVEWEDRYEPWLTRPARYRLSASRWFPPEPDMADDP